MSAPCANSLISITVRTCAHATHKPLCTLNLSQTKKKLKFGPRIPTPNTLAMDNCKRRLSVALVLGLGILDSALYLTQYSIIKELA